eukprot:8386496-Ditylum_brightwellii.AAC.1
MDRLGAAENHLKEEMGLKRGLGNKLGELEKQLSESNEHLESSCARSSFQGAEITKVQKLITDLSYEKQQLIEECSGVSDQLKNLKAEADTLSKLWKQKEDELMKEVANHCLFTSQVQNTLEKLQNDSQAEIAQLQNTLSNLKEENKMLAKEHSEATNRLKHLEEDVEKSSTDHDSHHGQSWHFDCGAME